ncbi:MAG: hypothetical protein ING71_17415 [Rhodocyclaceae bacterium]|nr:hypothetical protein [Rhodocyclaceae bacterium]
MTPLETLKAARQLISDPAKWTHGWLARDADGNVSHIGEKDAACWCSMGAIFHVDGPERPNSYAALQLLGAAIGGKSVARFNDTRTHAEVLALFDAAIAELEGVQS